MKYYAINIDSREGESELHHILYPTRERAKNALKTLVGVETEENYIDYSGEYSDEEHHYYIVEMTVEG